MQTTKKITLDLYEKNLVSVSAKQLDTETRYIEITCVDRGIIFTLDKTKVSAFIRYKKPDNNGIFNCCEITDNNTIKFELTQQMLAVSGRAIADIMLIDKVYTNNDKPLKDSDINAPIISIMDFYINITPTALNHSQIESSYEFNALTNALARIDYNNKKVEQLDKTLTENENIRNNNESERKSNEQTRINSENQRINAENIRNTAEDKRTKSESERIQQENTRNTNENQRISNENIRIENENTRKNNENARISNENERKNNETNRISAENKRNSNETNRQSNESTRIENEDIRKNNESLRTSNENERINAESERKNNESTRISNENTRQSQESKRQTDSATAVANANNAAKNANDKANILQSKLDNHDFIFVSDLENSVTSTSTTHAPTSNAVKTAYDKAVSVENTINLNKNNWNDKYTKNEIDNKFSTLESNIDWKESVSTYADIAKTYPNPQDGWTVNVKDTDYTYRYSGTSWIAISANAIPKATQSVDGLLSKEDKINYDDANSKKHTHSNKSVIDGITSALITTWNTVTNKLDKTGDASNVTNTITTASTRANLSTGEKLSVSLGKIAKWFADLKNVAFTGSYNDLSNKPTSLPANGGNATTVNGHTVNSDVPSGAKFTDTNTWRGIQDNLTSTSTTDSLSANQGKILKGLVDGKAASNHTHSYLPLSGGTISGRITRSGGGAWISDRRNVAVFGTNTNKDSYNPVVGQKTPNGAWTIGNLGDGEKLVFNYTTDADYNSDNNNCVPVFLPNVAGTIALTSQIPSVGNGTVTITQNGTSKGTFTMNQSGNTTIALTDNNTTYSTGNASTAGLTKLYTSTGTATDGTMTQAAIKSALDGKAFSSHNHANLDSIGSVGYYGSDSANTSGWYKVYSTTLTGHADHVARLSIISGYSTIANGIINLHLRCHNSSTIKVDRLSWENRQGFSVGDVIINTNGNTWTLYVKQSNSQYGRIKVRVLESCATSSNWAMTLTSNTTKESSTPTATVTATDGATVNYANSAGSIAWNNVSNKPSLGTASSKTIRTLSSVSDSGWANPNVDRQYVPDMAFIAWWNGAYSGSASNLTYCNKGAFGTAATANKEDFAALTHTHSYLPLSGGTLTGDLLSTNINLGSVDYPWKNGYITNIKTNKIYPPDNKKKISIYGDVDIFEGGKTEDPRLKIRNNRIDLLKTDTGDSVAYFSGDKINFNSNLFAIRDGLEKSLEISYDSFYLKAGNIQLYSRSNKPIQIGQTHAITEINKHSIYMYAESDVLTNVVTGDKFVREGFVGLSQTHAYLGVVEESINNKGNYFDLDGLTEKDLKYGYYITYDGDTKIKSRRFRVSGDTYSTDALEIYNKDDDFHTFKFRTGTGSNFQMEENNFTSYLSEFMLYNQADDELIFTANNYYIHSYRHLIAHDDLTVKGNIVTPNNADYAEAFDFEGQILEVGTIVELCDNKKIKTATKNSDKVIGVVSNSYWILAGSTKEDIQTNKKVAVGLVGQIKILIHGIVKYGDYIVSDANGIGVVNNNATRGSIIGRAMESSDNEEQKMITCIIQPM